MSNGTSKKMTACTAGHPVQIVWPKGTPAPVVTRCRRCDG